LTFIVFELLKRIEPKSPTLYGPLFSDFTYTQMAQRKKSIFVQ